MATHTGFVGFNGRDRVFLIKDTICEYTQIITHKAKSVAAKQSAQLPAAHIYTMAESATPVKLFGKWSLEDVEVSDLALVVRKKLEQTRSWFSKF